MAKYFFTLGLIIGTAEQELFGQFGQIQTDRPDQTECPFIVPKHWLQAENGFMKEKISASETSYTHPSTLWRFGLSNVFECRMVTEFQTVKKSGISYSGMGPVTAGVKIKIAEAKGLLPETAFIGHLSFNQLAGKDFKGNFATPSFRFVMQHTLSDKWSLGYNLGAEWNEESPAAAYIYTLVTGFSISSKMGAYAEVYGFVPEQSKAGHYVNGGITWYFTDHIMADVSAGQGLFDNKAQNFISAGLSYRFSFSK